MEEWGNILLARYGKERYAYKRDYILTHLGYSTVCVRVCVCVSEILSIERPSHSAKGTSIASSGSFAAVVPVLSFH